MSLLYCMAQTAGAHCVNNWHSHSAGCGVGRGFPRFKFPAGTRGTLVPVPGVPLVCWYAGML
eukprot:1743660-Rhodomonas_salina.1